MGLRGETMDIRLTVVPCTHPHECTTFCGSVTRLVQSPAPVASFGMTTPPGRAPVAVERGAMRTAKVAQMQFLAGQTVVHPQHGPSTVTQVIHRSMKGVSRSYVELQVHRTDLRVSVPIDTADDVGLRLPSTATQLQELWEVLREPTLHEEEQWSRRMKGNQERLRIGELLATAKVVRDLTRRQDTRGLSAGERDLLKSARQPLVVELGLSLALSDEEAENMLDAAIRGEEPRTAPPVLATV